MARLTEYDVIEPARRLLGARPGQSLLDRIRSVVKLIAAAQAIAKDCEARPGAYLNVRGLDGLLAALEEIEKGS